MVFKRKIYDKLIKWKNKSEPNVSLSQTKLFDEYKLYLADTGLFTTLLFNGDSIALEDIYSKLLSDKLPTNLGYLYENVVAQMIIASSRGLYYYTWQKNKSTHSYEIGFLIRENQKVIPVEVKSSRIRPHDSLDEIGKKYSKRIGRKWLLSQRDVGQVDDIELWPVYCLPLLLENSHFLSSEKMSSNRRRDSS